MSLACGSCRPGPEPPSGVIGPEWFPRGWGALVRCHHERPDGVGYPRALTGTEVPVEALIIAVCDAYDAMTSDWVYRKALRASVAM